jgi:heat shock protein HslJ
MDMGAPRGIKKERAMSIRRTAVVSVTVVATILLAACGKPSQGQPPAQGSSLADSEWVLVLLNGKAPIEGSAITLRFGETSIEGSGGCNTYGGRYTASGDSLRLNDLYWTEIGCIDPKGIMEQEQAYLQVLGAVARYRVAQGQGGGDRLEVYDEAGTQILGFVAPTSDAPVEQETPTSTTTGISLDCVLDVDETYLVGEPVNLAFALGSRTDRTLYVLTWYTPLEGMAGDILQVTRDGTALPYQGMLAKRGDPTREEYVAIEPGEAASAIVDLRMGYDLSAPGSYRVQFTAGLQDATDNASLIPRKRDDHRPQAVTCNTVRFSIAPAPEAPTATPTPVPPTATPSPEPSTATPAGWKRYVDAASGVSLFVPEGWTVVPPGPQGGTTILSSYPKDKYVGGEARQPGDTKCDLTVHPPGVSVADVVPQTRSDPPVTVVSEQEVVLQSGRTGQRFEVESMGRSLSLVTEVNGRAVVLTCFGEPAPFDAIAVTLG